MRCGRLTLLYIPYPNRVPYFPNSARNHSCSHWLCCRGNSDFGFPLAFSNLPPVWIFSTLAHPRNPTRLVGHDIPNYQLACKLIHQNLLFNSNGTKTKPVIDICYPLNISAHHMKNCKKTLPASSWNSLTWRLVHSKVWLKHSVRSWVVYLQIGLILITFSTKNPEENINF